MTPFGHIAYLVKCTDHANFALCFCYANVAQLVEQLIRNEQVTGSSPVIGSRLYTPAMPQHSGRCSFTWQLWT